MRSKVEEDVEVLHQRQAIVSSKSPAELSQIHSFAEVPIPRAVESWLHQGGEEGSKSVFSLTTYFLHTYVEQFSASSFTNLKNGNFYSHICSCDVLTKRPS